MLSLVNLLSFFDIRPNEKQRQSLKSMVIVQSFVIYYDLKSAGIEFAEGQTALKNPRPDSVIKTHKTVLKNQALYLPHTRGWL